MFFPFGCALLVELVRVRNTEVSVCCQKFD